MKVVVIGGGTGSFAVLNGLKKYPIDITSLVTVADNGGSTGRLRDEFGILPPGDFRMALVALADESISQELRDLFLYRFDKGDGLKGHNFGNLFLVALTEIFSSYSDALKFASTLLKIKGRVLPISDESLTLLAQYEDNSIQREEKHIDDPGEDHDGKLRITSIWVEPESVSNSEAIGAILDADFVITGPGDLYTSLIANFVVGGVSSAMKKTEAKFIYIANLINKFGHTHGFKSSDYVAEIEKYSTRTPDFVLLNTTPIDKAILKSYEKENGFPIVDDFDGSEDYKVVRADLLASGVAKKQSGDALKRSLARHDADKLAWEIFKILKDN
ncbi:MAG: gluconeogenesis factor YvcK family protein [Patescibacteria group bacterium]